MIICWAFACTLIPGLIEQSKLGGLQTVMTYLTGTTREIVRYFEAINPHRTSGKKFRDRHRSWKQECFAHWRSPDRYLQSVLSIFAMRRV
jgi:hypothetical protein